MTFALVALAVLYVAGLVLTLSALTFIVYVMSQPAGRTSLRQIAWNVGVSIGWPVFWAWVLISDHRGGQR